MVPGRTLGNVTQDDGSDLVAPPLPVRASIYIAPDGTVHFGALFADLLPVAVALGGATSTDSARSASAPLSASPAWSGISPPKAAD